MKITYSIDWERGIDPYRRDTGGQTVPEMHLIIGDDDIHVVVEQCNPGQTGTWTDEFLYVCVDIPPMHDEYGYDQTPNEEALGQYIHSPAAQALIQRIAAGYDTEWSGPRYGEGYRQAVLDRDAAEALAELETAIADLPTSTVVWWNVEEWFSQTDWHGIDGSTVDQYIAAPTNNDEDIGLTEDPTNYILEKVADQLDDELYMINAPANLLTVRGILVVVDRDHDGDIDSVVAVTTPAGHHWNMPNRPTMPITIQDIAHGFGITPRRARALAKNRHERFGVGQQLPGGQWVFRPEDLDILAPDEKYRTGPKASPTARSDSR